MTTKVNVKKVCFFINRTQSYLYVITKYFFLSKYPLILYLKSQFLTEFMRDNS